MHDHVIRSAFHHQMLGAYHACADAIVIDELGIRNGSSRADIAIINGKLEGFEIKSEFDSLVRLPSQVNAYNSIFEKSSIITCPKHLEEVKAIVPDYWGIFSYRQNKSGRITFSCLRKSKKNKNVDPYSIVQLLWRDEAFELAKSFSLDSLSNKMTRYKLYYMLSTQIQKELLIKNVLTLLKQRQDWRKDPLQLS